MSLGLTPPGIRTSSLAHSQSHTLSLTAHPVWYVISLIIAHADALIAEMNSTH